MILFKIAETKSFQKLKIDKKLKEKIKKEVYSTLRENPFYGKHIKKLKGIFEGIYRYRIGNYRLFYTVDNDKIIVIVLDLKQRKDSYKGQK